jgi:hypothetical protein
MCARVGSWRGTIACRHGQLSRFAPAPPEVCTHELQVVVTIQLSTVKIVSAHAKAQTQEGGRMRGG